MPLIYKIPGYVGNALLLVLSLTMLAGGNDTIGGILGALAVLNLFLIYKLDRFSQEEVWLEHELQVAKLKEELLLEQRRVGELEALQAGRLPTQPPADPPSPTADKATGQGESTNSTKAAGSAGNKAGGDSV